MQTNEPATVRWGEWIGEGWQMFANQWQGWLLLMLVFVVIMAVPLVPLYILIFAAQFATINDPDAQAPPFLFFALMPIIYLLIIFGSAYLMSGAYRAAFRQMRGERIQVGDIFSAGDVFLRVAGAVLLIGVLSVIGALLCFFPGLIVAGLFSFTLPLIIDGKLGVIDAMRASFERTKGNWFMFTLFILVVSLLAQIGSVACGIGIIVTFPLYFTIHTVAFRDLFGVSGAHRFLAQQAPAAAADPQQWSPPVQSAGTGLKCPRCSAPVLSPSAKFCNVCGATLQG